MTTIRTTLALRIALLIFMAIAATACGRDNESSRTQRDADTNRSVQKSLSDTSVSVQMTPDQMEQTFGALATAVESVPRDAFEPQALAKTIGANPDVLVAWVRDNTYWVPYRGAMRGAAGVLMDRIGNSLDRSLLLAELLRSSGHEVRLARGEISQPYLQPLLAELTTSFPAPAERRAPELTVIPEEDIADYARQLHFDAKQLSRTLSDSRATYIKLTDEMGERIDRQVPFLTQAARPFSTTSGQKVRPISGLRDHWWVQLRDEKGWADLDVTLSAEQRNAAQVATMETFPFDKPSGEIPLGSQYAHEITIRVIAEQWKAGHVKENIVLEHNFRPGELIGQPILFQNSPLNSESDLPRPSDSDPMQAFADWMLEKKEWLPNLIIGEQSISHYGVDESGELILDPLSSKPPAGPGTVADTLAGSDSFGDNEDAPQSDSYFTAEWIEYEIRVPGERASTTRRQVFDMLAGRSRNAQPISDPAPNHNRRLQRALKLAGSIQTLPVVSRFPREFLAYQGILQNLRNREALVEIKKQTSKQDIAGVLDQVRRYIPTSVRLFDLSLARFEMSGVGSEVYLDSPNILSYRRTLDFNAQNQLVQEQGFDIVANSVAVSPKSRKTPFDVRLSQGVADTNTEAVLMERDTSNAGSLLERQQGSASWLVIRKAEDMEALGADWTPAARARLAESTQAGYIVIAPKSPDKVYGEDWSTWWRIDPVTGATLGIDQEGRGAAGEKVVIDIKGALQSAAAVGFASGVCGFTLCVVSAAIAGNEEFPAGPCACVALEVGVSLGGTALGAAGGPKMMAVGFAIGASVAKSLCKPLKFHS